MVPGGFSLAGTDLVSGVWITVGFAILALVVVFGMAWTIVNASQIVPVVRERARVTGRPQDPSGTAARADPLTDGSDLPTIDLLLPAADAADAIEPAISSVRSADYPADRLHVHAITEPDDAETVSILRRLSDTSDVRVYQVPPDYPGEPSTARALNYAYVHTNAALVGVVGPETLVDPGLFRAVAGAFRDRRCDVAIAHPDRAHGDDGRDRLSRADSGSRYDVAVPPVVRAGHPHSRDGVACFYRRAVLDAVAEDRFERYGSPWSLADRLWLLEHDLHRPVPWEPDDVTGDVELGQLLWEAGYAFEQLDPVSTAESLTDRTDWFDQRVRGEQG